MSRMPTHIKALPKGHPDKQEWLRWRLYLQGSRWRKLRGLALIRAGQSCEVCGATGVRLLLHHRHYDTRYREELGDVEVVCSRCHAKRHRRPAQA